MKEVEEETDPWKKHLVRPSSKSSATLEARREQERLKTEAIQKAAEQKEKLELERLEKLRLEEMQKKEHDKKRIQRRKELEWEKVHGDPIPKELKK